MTSNPGFSNRCPHCGYWLPPNQAGPCPKCGRELHAVLLATPEEKKAGPIDLSIQTTSGKTIKVTLNDAVAIRDEIVGIVNTSAATAGLISSQSWPVFYRAFNEKMDSLEKRLEKLPELQKRVLEQHETERNARERTTWNRFKRVVDKLFWIAIGGVLTRIIVLWLFGR